MEIKSVIKLNQLQRILDERGVVEVVFENKKEVRKHLIDETSDNTVINVDSFEIIPANDEPDWYNFETVILRDSETANTYLIKIDENIQLF